MNSERQLSEEGMMKARENPFSVSRVHRIRFRPQGLGWDDLMARLAEMDYRGALVGPMGSGKTTLLLELEPRLKAMGYGVKKLFLNRDIRRFRPGEARRFLASLEAHDIILFDGANELSLFWWWAFLFRSRRAAGLIITQHEPGRLPTLLDTSTSLALFEEVVREVAPDEFPGVEALLTGLYEQHNGNIRDAIRSLYDHYSRQ